MAYPTRLLHPGERAVVDRRPHWWFFGSQILSGAPLLLVVVAVLAWSSSGVLHDAAGLLVGLASAVWLGWVACKWVAWRCTYFVVTDERVIFRTGVIARRGSEIPLDRVTNINFRQRVFERIVGAGDLDVQSAGEQGTSTFNFVRHPDDVQHTIYAQMEARVRRLSAAEAAEVGSAISQSVAEATAAGPGGSGSNGSTGDRGGSGAGDVADQIAKLGALRNAGHLTDAEFDAKKAELLARW